MSNTLKEKLEKLNRGLRMQLYAAVLPFAMTPPRESFGGGHSEVITSEEGTLRRIRDNFRQEPETYILPPEPKVLDTVFSDVYQAEVPRNLYEAGIEDLNVETGKAVLRMQGIVSGARNLRGDGFGCTLDLQDSVMRMYSGLGQHLEKVDETALIKQLGVDNPIVKLVQDAGESYQATVRRKSNLDTLMEQNPNDMTAVFNRYHG